MAQLQLARHSRYDVYLQRRARNATSGYPSDAAAHLGGSHETAAVADTATDQPTSRRSTPLGSGLSAPPAVDAVTTEGAGDDQPSNQTGGIS
jgi:hypothetical protein